MGSKSKKRDPSPSSSSDSEAEDVKVQSASSSPEPSKKRKRTAPVAEEIEVDVTAPEPLSKAEARKAKKAKTKPSKTEDGTEKTGEEAAAATVTDGSKRSEHGIWIGNLPFSADKTVVRVFFTRQGQIPDADITRVHMPTPQHAQPGRVKPKNKGFAYVDFGTVESLQKAIALSDSLMTGRKVLIKDAKSFEGRPSQNIVGPTAAALNGATEEGGETASGTAAKPGKPIMAPSKRVFVGNLGFDVTKEDLEYHFGQAGEIEDVHMATFQDTGKCKGFAWVRFVELEAAQGAVQGFVFKEEPASDDEEEEEQESSSGADSDEEKPKKSKMAKKAKKPKKRKWFINRLQGRPLRCEFAEDASTRYKKRFGKGGSKNEDQSGDADGGAPITEVDGEPSAYKPKARLRGTKEERQEQRRQKHVDARNIRPGAALANAPRASGGIVKAEGKKISFDD